MTSGQGEEVIALLQQLQEIGWMLQFGVGWVVGQLTFFTMREGAGKPFFWS